MDKLYDKVTQSQHPSREDVKLGPSRKETQKEPKKYPEPTLPFFEYTLRSRELPTTLGTKHYEGNKLLTARANSFTQDRGLATLAEMAWGGPTWRVGPKV